MPRREDIKKILIIGSGPIIISQAAEFDYSGYQACRALKEDGYEVVLVNSNPATIMTDPDTADRTYIEPLTPEVLEKIIQLEKPNALLPTLGGQTGLNLATILADRGVLSRHGVKLIGAQPEAIKKGEDRELFKKSMEKLGLEVPRSGMAKSAEEAVELAARFGYPLVIKPSFTLGGTGGGIAYNAEELKRITQRGLSLSLTREVMIEEGLIGWKEFELEVMRDSAGNAVIVCAIENLDPLGIHTGDSITVAPTQTLTDMEYQALRDAAIRIMGEIGVETGGSNIQFAIHPKNGRVVVIEMNPRVSRSSALASKATGFPIAKIAAKLAVGYTLDEIPNDITRETPASFEPTLDYVVVKIPRFAFDKFPSADDRLTTQMKSVGEVMAIGRCFEEALQKAIRSLEIGRAGFGGDGKEKELTEEEISRRLVQANHERIFHILAALKNGFAVQKIADLTGIDPWFIDRMKGIVDFEEELGHFSLASLPDDLLKEAKRLGFSDRQLAYLLGSTEAEVRRSRKSKGLLAAFKMVDTCAGEFEAKTPYFYSTYGEETDSAPKERRKVVILGSGPNRIGQGIEFDYCCVHASSSLKEEGLDALMVNSNPETVSTDYDVSDRLYFEPITYEDVMSILDCERPEGVVVQFGGQTPLNITEELSKSGIRILGTSPDAIDRAGDRKRFADLLRKLDIPQAENGVALTVEEAKTTANRLGYPVLIRPSYVLGGRAMETVYDERSLIESMVEALKVSPGKPVLIDKFIEDALEVDVDALCDGEQIVIGGILEHIEEAGVHSGDCACVLPPISLGSKVIETLISYTRRISLELGVVGLINVQYAVKGDRVYVIEANPRASRTVPFVSKATGLPMAKIAMKLMLGRKLSDLGIKERLNLGYLAVKEAVLPFSKLPGVDPVLGPEMKSTGEVMGIDHSFGMAYYKAELAAGTCLPMAGTVLISVNDRDKPHILPIARELLGLGFKLVATHGTAEHLRESGVPVKEVAKVGEVRPNITDMIVSGEIDLVINSPSGERSKKDGFYIRRVAVENNVPYITTLQAAFAAAHGIKAMKNGAIEPKPLQEYHSDVGMMMRQVG